MRVVYCTARRNHASIAVVIAAITRECEPHMEFFGLSSAKIILILIIAVVLLGPDQVPQMVRTVGKFIRDFRRFTSEMSKEFNEATGDLRKEFTDTIGDLKGEIEQTQSDLRSQLDPLTDTLRDPLGLQTAQASPVPVAAAIPLTPMDATTTTETNPFAAQVPAYTPPQAQTWMPPEAAPVLAETNGFDSHSTNGSDSGNGTNATYTNGVNGVYTNGTGYGTNGINGSASAPVRATKADPFADLVTLAPVPASPPVPDFTTVTSADVATFAPVPLPPMSSEAGESASESAPELVAVADAPVSLPVGKAVVGRGVSGTRYGRKRAS